MLRLRQLVAQHETEIQRLQSELKSRDREHTEALNRVQKQHEHDLEGAQQTNRVVQSATEGQQQVHEQAQVQGGSEAGLLEGPATRADQLCSQLFDCLDVDGSGTLEPPEVRQFLKMSGTPDSELDYYLADALRVADKNQVGS